MNPPLVPPEGSDPPSPPTGTDQAPGPQAGDRAAIDAYVAANAGRYTDEAITAVLIQAGHSPDEVRASIAAAASDERTRPATPRAVRTIIAAYVVTYLLLSAGMLLNSSHPSSTYMPTAAGGIGLLALSLGIAFVLSMIWVASRRGFVIVVVLVAAVSVFSSLTSGGVISIGILLVLVVAIVWLVRRRGSTGVRTDTALGVLLAIPILLLLVVGGICVASGLPIPSAG